MSAETRLATYGTIAPGRANAHELAGLSGGWLAGTVRGRLAAAGWGAGLGYPGLVLDPQGEAVAVAILDSPDLPAHWARLDALEGPGYRRVATRAATAEGPLEVSLYEIVV